MRAYNALGWGPYAPPLRLQTMDGTPPGQPGTPTNGGTIAGVSDVISIFVIWSSPSAVAYPIDGFELVIRNSTAAVIANLTLGARPSYLFRCGGAQTLSSSTGCTPNTTYFFSVRARNVKGYGPSSSTAILSTAVARPPYTPAPPQQRIETDYWQAKTIIAVYWNRPYSEGMCTCKRRVRSLAHGR